MYTAHVCVVIEPRIVVDVDCDYMDLGEDGSIQLYRGSPLDLVAHFPSIEYVHLSGAPSTLLEAPDEPDDEDDEDDDDDYDDLDDELNDLADVSHVTDPGGDTSALNGGSPGAAIVGSVDEG